LAQLDRSMLEVETLLAKQQAEFEAAWQRLAGRHPQKAKSVWRRVEQMTRRARLREATRSEYTRDRWLVRSFALRAGQLANLGDDIFFLTLDELLAVLNGDESATVNIPARRKTYDRYKALPPYPSLIRGHFDPFQWATNSNRRSDIFDASTPLPDFDPTALTNITGFPGSAGRVEGLVRCMDKPDSGHQLQSGEVLVTIQTDIAWTPLFPRAAAIVTDVGAPLSHAAIVARELGIPAVVGCGSATMRLQTGDRVRVDGGRGIVEILEVAGCHSDRSH
jgi:pyruvate,water dikinase